jgi:hypothetical protein
MPNNVTVTLPPTFPTLSRQLRRGDYTLRMFTSVAQGKQPIGTITADVFDWKRSKTFVGTDWRGTFKMRGPQTVLEKLFYEGLGYHIQEHSYGGRTWIGFIWEMDLVTPGGRRARRRRRSYDTLFNYVRCDYTDPADGTTGSTSWYSDNASIARYGRKEEILQRNLNATNAAEAAQEFLELSSGASPTLVSFEGNVDEPILEVTLAGYITTASFRFTLTTDNSASTVSNWVTAVVNTDCEFLSPLKIDTNSRSIQRSLTTPTRALTLLEDLLSLRDGSGNSFNIVTNPDRKLSYKQLSNSPIGQIRGGVFHTMSGQNLEDVPRIMQAGIYRDSDYLAGIKGQTVLTSNTFFATPADFLLETVEINETGEVVPRLGLYEDEEAVTTFTFEAPENG